MGTEGKRDEQIRTIVCDTGPILHLKEAKLLDLLQLAGKVYIPEMVNSEMNNLDPLWKKEKPEWISTKHLLPDEAREASSLFLSGLLDFGEAEAIILAKRLRPEWFLTDDVAARIMAKSLGMEVHGSLGVVLWSAAVGRLDYSQSKKAFKRLSDTSLWISKGILLEAQNALDAIFYGSLT